MGKVSIVGAGMQPPSRGRRQGLRDARRAGDQHRDDLHLADQDLLRGRRATASRDAVRALHSAFELRGRRRSAEQPVRRVRMSGLPRRRRGRHRAPSARRCSAAARARSSPTPRSSRSPPSARPGASSTAALVVQPLTRGGDRGLRPRAVLGRRRASRASGRRASPRRGAVRGRQLERVAHGADVPLVVAEVNPEALDGHQRDHRQPELLDDADGDGAQADPRRGRHRARWSSRPTSRSPAPASGGRGAARPGPGGPRRRRAARGRAVYPHQIAFNVLPQVETSRTATTTPTRSAR